MRGFGCSTCPADCELSVRCLTFFPLVVPADLSQRLSSHSLHPLVVCSQLRHRGAGLHRLPLHHLRQLLRPFTTHITRTWRAGTENGSIDECSLRSAFVSYICPFVLPCLPCLRCPSLKRSVLQSIFRSHTPLRLSAGGNRIIGGRKLTGVVLLVPFRVVMFSDCRPSG